MDKADLIAGYAREYDKLLLTEGYGVDQVIEAQANDIVRGLSAQGVGVYTMMLCRIYEENAPVEYHVMRLSTYCGMREPRHADREGFRGD